MLKGWRGTVEDALCPYSQRSNELSIQDGVVLWGCRVVVSKASEEKVIDLLHKSHPGVVRMKSLTRSIVWWPGIENDIEKKVRRYQQCQLNQYVCYI